MNHKTISAISLIPLAFTVVAFLNGCAHEPSVVKEEPRSYADPVIPPAPAPATESIRETAVASTDTVRGGAALRLAENSDVLANVHYEGVETSEQQRGLENDAEKPDEKDVLDASNRSTYREGSLVKEKKKAGNNSARCDRSVYGENKKAVKCTSNQDRSVYRQFAK